MFKEIEGFQLSPQQKHLWQLQQSDRLPYRAQCAVLIEGNLDIASLKFAIEQVVNRYEILRTNYKCLPGMSIPLQVIAEGCVSWGNNCDLSIYPPEEQEVRFQALFQQLSQQNLNLESGSVIQLTLAILSPLKYVLILSLPALCADSATLQNLVKEIGRFYGAGDRQELLQETLQYADLAAWQNDLLSEADTEAGRDYWRKQDFSALSVPLPRQKQLVAELEFKPQTYKFSIDANLLTKITALSQHYNTSVAEFFLTCWYILIWRLTAQENLVIGVIADGRKHEELASTLGLLSKYLPLQINLKSDNSFAKTLCKLSEKSVENHQYQEYFDWTQIAQINPYIPQFLPLGFEFEKQWKYAIDRLSFSVYEQYVCIDRFQLKLSCLHRENCIDVALVYDRNLFALEDIKRWAEQLEALIESAIAHPNVAIDRLQILSETQRKQLLANNNTKLNYSKNKCIHQLFEARVASTPNKVAVVFAEQQLSYSEVNSRANKIARYLQQLGVGAEVLVGLYVERSPLMILGILGILKAGGAYVPLDPAYPQERLAFMLQNSQPRVLLTQESLIKELPECAAQIVCLDTDWDAIAQHSAENLSQSAIAANLAYIIYTSGSTGTPKGVRVAHSNLCHYVQAMQFALGIKAEDVYLHTASLAFSSSVRQLMVPLTQGATVTVATTEQRKDPLALFAAIAQYNVTAIDIVPSYWRNCNYVLSNLAPESRQALLNNKLRLILSASEALMSDIPATWTLGFQHGARIINMFGQTETCGIVATYPVPTQQDEQVKVMPLGRPIPNTQIYLLDRHLQLVPIGVPGELYVGGWGLGQGYLNSPNLTAAQFIPHPYSDTPGDRLYKTGDLGRYLPDGTIEFLGRSDYQVKIRGFRIELAEIEAALSQHPAIRETVVVARQEAGEKSLVAYVTLNSKSQIQKPKSSDLSNFLRERLPDYTIPSAFVMLDALPLTPNGKVNRQALPAPEQVLEVRSLAAPRTPVEEVLAGIWAKTLNLKQVGFGIDDNFFELGGHSLLATQVISQVRQAFQVDLPLRSLFESPTVAGLAEQIETALRDGQKLKIPAIARMARDRIPLSFAQQRLWFLDQFQPGNCTYNLSRALLLQGQLNVAALEQSLQEIVRRHEALRTTFTTLDGQPVQAIQPTLTIELPIVDLSALSPEARAAETQHLAQQEARHCFDLTVDPLLRTILLQLAAQEYVLLFTIHHIVADGWSAGIIVREVAALYKSFCQGLPSPLPELPIQYADYAVWQRQCLHQETLAAQMEYWQQQLSGDLPVLELPTDRPRSAMQTFAGSKQVFELSQSLTEAIKSLSQQEEVTLFMTLLAAFKTLLHRYTGQADILIGSPIANRNSSEIEGLIGFFVNTLVLRTDLSGNPSFRELLKRVREVSLGAYAHQDLPFEQLVELQPRNLSYTPLFQVMFALQNAPTEALELPGLELKFLQVETETARFDLTLSLTDTARGLIGELEYNTDLFDRATIARMLGHFQTLLESIVANPDCFLSDLPILTQIEQQQLLVDWNQTQVDYPNVCIHQLFEAQVERSPDAVAVVFSGQQLTYKQLNARANRLASYLQALGVGSEVLVGICVERSLEMVVGLLGILKAGGAYVPLDPAYPPARLAFMLQDAQVSVLLTQKQLLTALPEHKAKVVCLDADWQDAQASTDNPIVRANSNNLAYVIYTSGSTGQPKGVQISHGAVANFLSSMRVTPGLSQEDILLSVTTLSFDIAGLEIYLPLIVGACLVVVSREVATDGTQLLEQLISSQATVMQATPATWRMLLAAGWQGKSKLKVLCGGEALDKTLASQLLERSAAVWNLYGPTETTIWSAVQPVTHQVERSHDVISIGRPIANTQFYILDSHQQLVPLGVPGELYIGGAGLARGYLNRAELTAEKFKNSQFTIHNSQLSRLYKTGEFENSQFTIHNSQLSRLYKTGEFENSQFTINADATLREHNSQLSRLYKTGEFENSQFTIDNSQLSRLYRTGDKARYLPDGTIEFLGRIDRQVKIRGFRIELGEIEAILNQHPAIEQAIAVVREDEPGDRRLVAYIVPRTETPSAPPAPPAPPALFTQLRRFLEQKLPIHMLPSAFVTLKQLPLTPNGKIDRSCLPAPENARSHLAETFVAPRNPVEEVVAGIWSQVLGVECLGVCDNFFELGGHSLLATQVISRLRQIFNIDLPLRRLFESPTIAGLATNIQQAMTAELGWKVGAIACVSRDRPLPLSFAQARLWLLEQLHPGNSIYNLTSAVRLVGSLQAAVLEQSLGEIVRRHEVLRTTFLVVDGQPVGAIAPTLTTTLPVVDLRQLSRDRQQAEVQRLIVEKCQRTFNLSQSSLLRSTLLHLGENEHIVLFAIHHIAADGWSMGVFVRELAALYEAFCNGKPSPLPELPIQYADFAVWQREWLQAEVLEAQISYWKRQLKDLPVLELPCDRPRPKFQTFHGTRQTLVLPQSLSTALKQLSVSCGVTLFMTLLAGFQTLLCWYADKEDIVVGTDVANRVAIETEPLIGFFVNQLVLRTDFSGNPSFQTLLARVREVTLEAYAHQDLPFDKLVEAVNPQRDLSRPPLFQVKFVLQAPMPPLELSGLTLSLLEVDKKTAEFDLLLEVTETEQGLNCCLKYNTDLFEPTSVARMLRELEIILSAVATQPEIKLNDIKAILLENNRQQSQIQEQEYQKTLEQKLSNVRRKSIR